MFVLKTIMSGEENTIGARATEMANQKAKEWIDQAMPMVEKTILALAGQVLFFPPLSFSLPVLLLFSLISFPGTLPSHCSL